MLGLGNLITESRNEATEDLDQMSVNKALRLMNEEDKKVAFSVEEALPQIENVVKLVIATFQQGGRLIYLGAGTSGRLGVLDAAECVPTFGVSPEMVIGLIAGGQKAMTIAVEGAEDNFELGKQDLEGLKLTANDIVIGIAASGRTPYVIGGLDYARKLGAKTATISCNLNSEIAKHTQSPIEVDCGPEFLTGSTRLKAGTAQKLILNMISTLSMIGIGKVYHNLMVDVKATNEKLIERSKLIIMQATDVNYECAEKIFYESGNNVKLAIVMILTGSSKEESEIKLLAANGFVKNAIK
ncbi:N-acetylmuramic acid 6-phosphate etherase [Pseudolactococcus yaeyamensis]